MPKPLRVNLESEDALCVLREISAESKMTQRILSMRLGLSLGKINFLIRSMAEKGLIKVENFKNSKNKRAYRYSLTPSGIAKKTAATSLFLKRKIEEYERLEVEIRQLKKEAGMVNMPDDIK